MLNLIACDMFTTDVKKLVVNILLINPHNQDVNGYRMVFYEDNINSNVLEEDVINVYGNDSILIYLRNSPPLAVVMYCRLCRMFNFEE